MFASIQAKRGSLRFYTIRGTPRGSDMYEDGNTWPLLSQCSNFNVFQDLLYLYAYAARWLSTDASNSAISTLKRGYRKLPKQSSSNSRKSDFAALIYLPLPWKRSSGTWKLHVLEVNKFIRLLRDMWSTNDLGHSEIRNFLWVMCLRVWGYYPLRL